MKRIFLAFDLSAQERINIQNWRDRAFPPLPSAIPFQNFHVTLAFLGNTRARELDSLIQLLDQKLDSMSQLPALTLNTFRVFPAKGFAWIQAGERNMLWNEYVSQVKGLLVPFNSVRKKNKPYEPHVSVFRANELLLESPLVEPNISIQPTKLSLYDSQRQTKTKSDTSHSNYKVLASWDI